MRKVLSAVASGALVLALAAPVSASESPRAEAEVEFIEWYNASPDNAAYFEWVVFMHDPANAAWFKWYTSPKPSVSTPYGVWDRLAQCESHGEWNYGPHSNWGSKIYHGGLQFHPKTWAAYKLPGYPTYAYQATRDQQIEVGKKVLASQGWRAWPDCSRKLDLR